MNKNIRRSIVTAAGVTGAWVLGSTAASADELPASSLSVSDTTTDATDLTEGVSSGMFRRMPPGSSGRSVGDVAGSVLPPVVSTAVEEASPSRSRPWPTRGRWRTA